MFPVIYVRVPQHMHHQAGNCVPGLCTNMAGTHVFFTYIVVRRRSRQSRGSSGNGPSSLATRSLARNPKPYRGTSLIRHRAPLGPYSTPVNPGPRTLNSKPETRNPKPETRNPIPETRSPKPETRNTSPETRNSDP